MILIYAYPYAKKITRYEITNVSDFSLEILSDYAIHELLINETDFTIDIAREHFLKIVNTQNFLRAYTYRALIEISLDDLMARERFITDYHAIRYLATDAGITPNEVFRVLVSLSNLLREGNLHGIDEMHLASIRVVRKYSAELDKTFYIITEF